ncbi:MAG: T9SS type A sorting domain-containing protein [Chitinophagales bacterium]|nr:T9SS type A sorting domain-containing protein [Chitinophagales bacterium]
MRKTKAILLLLSAIWCSGGATAQSVSKSVLASNGGETITTPYIYTWTTGESIIANTTVVSYIITQGFHPNGDAATGIQKVESTIGLNVYPNPTGDVLNVQISNVAEGNLVLQVYDVNGKLCLPLQAIGTGAGQNTNLNFSSLTSGTYYISVLKGTQKQNTVTVIKQ